MGRKNVTSRQTTTRKSCSVPKKSYKRRHQIRKALMEKLKDQSEENDRIYGALKASDVKEKSSKVDVPDVGSSKERQHAVHVVESVSKSIDRVVAAMKEL